MFLPLEPALAAASRDQACRQLRGADATAAGSQTYDHPLLGTCYLTARKFPASTRDAVLRLFVRTCRAAADGNATLGHAAAPAAPAGAAGAAAGAAGADGPLILLVGRACELAARDQLVPD